MKWIIFEDKVPVISDTYEVMNIEEGKKGTAYWNGIEFIDINYNVGSLWCSISKITHWMPLPKAPEEDEVEKH